MPPSLKSRRETTREAAVTGPLSPGKPVECLEQERIGAENLIIPYGSTIEHTDNDVTRIIRPDGSILGWANDREVDEIPVPDNGFLPTIRVYEVESGSVINHQENGNIYITNSAIKPELYIKEPSAQPTDSKSSHLATNQKEPSINSATIADINENWVEFANQTYSSSTNDIASFKARWNVPNKPQETRRNEVPAPRGSTWTNTTSMAAWMGVESLDSKGLGQGVFQSVLAWNWINDPKYGSTEKNWSAAIWDVGATSSYAISTHISSNGLAINTGDEMRSTIKYDSSSKKWDGTLTLVPQSGTPTEVTFSKNFATLDPKKVDLELVDEAYILKFNYGKNSTSHLQKYMFSNVRFTNIEIKNQKGEIISNNFVPYIVKDWNDHKSECPNLDVTIDSNPYKVWLHTTS
jgi:hypothetical protein